MQSVPYFDNLGTVIAITNEAGIIVKEFNYDAWGNKRNPEDWTYELEEENGELSWFKKGYTGHEHLEEFGLINMNSRLYDPLVGRMLSPDNYIQSAGFSQNYNRYSYVFNNPLKYTDPSGDLIFTALFFLTVKVLLYTTDLGYNIQKHISPIAVQIDIKTGEHQRGIGINFSKGTPQVFGKSARVHGGGTYYTVNNQAPKGWEFRYGYEVSAFKGALVIGSTYYSHQNGNGEFKQNVGNVRIGKPMLSANYHNDWWGGFPGDGGDRWRTAALRLNVGRISVGFNLQTGDPGFNQKDRYRLSDESGQLYYQVNQNGDNPDKHRMGVGYIGIGGLVRFGNDKESRRYQIQNEIVHQPFGMPYFNYVNQPNRNYFQLGTDTMW